MVGGIRSWPGGPPCCEPWPPASGAAPSALCTDRSELAVGGGSLTPAADLRTGRITAGRRTPVVSRSSPGGTSGCMRGVNQPPPLLPLPPPDGPLSADVVVGASMVCLASNIFRSVGVLPPSEAACFPRGLLAFPRSLKRPIQPYPTHIPAAYGQVRRECDIARSALLRHPAADQNRSRPYRPSACAQVPP